MQFQLYLKRRGKWRQVLDVAASLGIPYVVEVGPLDTSRSPITTALELGDVSPEALVLPRDAVDKFEWYIMLADALDVKRLVVAPPPTVEGVAELYDVAVEYGVEVNWIYGEGPLARIRDVDAVAKAIRPTAARLVYDPVKAKGLKEIYTTIIALSGYIREIYLSNRRGERGPRLPPFDPVGIINYAEVLQMLHLIQWEGRATVRTAPQFAGELDLQLKIANEVINTAKSAGVSRKVQKRVAQIYDELMGW